MTSSPEESAAAPRRLVIVGAGEFASIAYEYFTHDSPYEVAAFSVERAYLGESTFLGCPVVPFEELLERYPPAEYDVYVAVTFTHLNRARTRLFKAARALGYRLASYVSSRAFVWHNATVGANCFIFEGTVIQHHARIGDNVVLWSGCQILHRAIVGDNCFFSAGVVVAGYGEVEQGCFVGANSTVRDFGRVARDCFIGMAAAVVKPTEPEGVYVGNPARPTGENSLTKFIPAGVPR